MNRLAHIFCAFLSISSLAAAQAPGSGLYALGSFDSRGFDSINLGNLNTHFEIPIVNKQGRGLPFTYTLSYDGLVWSTLNNSGTGTWVPDSGWGFHGVLLGGSFTGYVTHTTNTMRCPEIDGLVVTGTRTDNYLYHDPYGRVHVFNYDTQYCPGTDDAPVPDGDGSTFDGSGYTYNPGDRTVHTRNGSVITAATSSSFLASGSIADSNGNIVQNNGNGTFTDTLGVTALTIGGSGTASSPLTLSYPVILQSNSATSAAVTIYYKTYTVQTNFQCSGIIDYGATSIDLIDHITLPDTPGSTYSFTYEATPGFSGSVTGRLASITLPTGGTISYSYSGGCNGSSGINSDGTVGGLTRTTSDGSRSYTRSPINANATSTKVQDEKLNQTLYQFTIANGMFYETHKDVYQGAVGGSNLLDRQTCYNGAAAPCDGAVVTLPFSQTTIVSSYNGVAPDTIQNSYDPSGMLTSSTQSQSGSTLLTQSTVYNTSELPTVVYALDGSGSLVTQTTYGYDEMAPTPTSGIPQHSVLSGSPGNQTSSHVTIGGSTINSTTAYYDTGVPLSTTTPNGTTQFSYDPTQTFTTQTTLPTPSSGVQLATSASYDQQSGVLISTTGMNAGQTTQVTQYDGLLHPASVSLPDGHQIWRFYYNTNETGLFQTMNSSTTTQVQTLYDGYGRQSRVAVWNGQSNNPWYQTDYCYDATGLLQFQSVRYQGNGWATPQQCSGSGTFYTYDALGRMTSSANTDGTATTQYNGRAVQSTDVNGVQKITQYDALGRITGVCEISSNASMPGSGSPISCGMDIGGTGFLTNYAYNLASHTTTVTQGAQTRVFQTDAAGRTIYTSEPERGVTTYSYAYNGTGLQITRTRPTANQTNPSVTTSTVTQYDSLGRMVSVSYDGGVTLNRNYAYDMATGWNGMSMGASKGQLTFAWTEPTLTGSQFVYDSMGQVVKSAQCFPNRCGNPAFDVDMNYSYDMVGNVIEDTRFLSASSGTEVDTNYSFSPAGELTSLSNTLTGATNYSGAILSNIQNGPNGPISYQYGNTRMGNSTYDSLGRYTGTEVQWLVGSSQCPTGCENYSMYSTIRGSQVQALGDIALNRNLTMAYDEFGRLTSTTNGVPGNSAVTSSYTYDRWGNRLSETSVPYEGGNSSFSFNTANNQIVDMAYDAAGNLIGDGFNTYTYDAEGNMIGSSYLSSSAVFDAFNRRVQYIVNGLNTQYGFNPAGQRVSMWSGSSTAPNLIETATYWNGRMVSYFDGTGTTFTHYDAFGTKRAETDYHEVGGFIDEWTSTYTSLPFGDGAGGGYGDGGRGGDGNFFAQLDALGLFDHAQFRDYFPTQGRWMSPDPYDGSYHWTNPQSFNRYAYARNNPLGKTDPSGLDPDSSDPGTDSPCDDVTCFVDPGEGGGGCTADACVIAPPDPPIDPISPGSCFTCILPPTPTGPTRTCIGPHCGQPAPPNDHTLKAPKNGSNTDDQWPLNGNLIPGTYPQDGVCTTGSLSGPMNRDPLVLACCQAHDNCYAQHQCNASSWVPVNVGACSGCNIQAVACIKQAVFPPLMPFIP